MQIVVKADSQQKEEFLAKGVPADVFITWLSGKMEMPIPEADAYFDLLFEEEGPAFSAITDKPVFVNAVIATGKDLQQNGIRINAWSGFLQRELLEVADKDSQNVSKGDQILQLLGWKYQLVPDVPGMIAARVIAMIVNEAYFALGDEISSPAEIDIAMKLGTNYPLGPFEWSKKIGLQKIYSLLKKLGENDRRYLVAPALEKEVIGKNINH